MAQLARPITWPAGRVHAFAAIAVAALVLVGMPLAADAGDEGTLLTEVHFDPGSATVTPGGLEKIQQAIAAIKKHGPSKIQIVGFADRTGDEAINRAISRSRAQNVADLLVERGVTTPLVVEGKGEEGAPYKIEDGVSEPLNRCVGIIAVNEDPLMRSPL